MSGARWVTGPVTSGGSQRLAHSILAGLSGWHRWGQWCAHFYVDGAQACDTPHGGYMGGYAVPARPKPAELAPSGVPYGKVCQRCLKLARLRA